MPIKVVFLTFYYEAWDALADIHDQMLADNRFEVTVISIPRRFTKDAPFADEDKVSADLDSLGVKHLRFNFEDSFEGLARLKALAPDYVFINYPWQRNYQPGYRVEELSDFTKVCYVPYYSLPLVAEPGVAGAAPHLYTLRSHQLASLVFTQDEEVLEAYADTSRGNKHVHLTGTPKIDALVRNVKQGEASWPIKNSGNQKLVWAPHHSYSNDWLNFGMFVKLYKPMLEFAKKHPEVDIVLRPHPLMLSGLVDRKVLSQAELDEWLAEWMALPNTEIYTSGDVARLFSAADIFITEGISFIGEYPLATGKPTIFFENEDHWQFSRLGELAARSNIRVRSFTEFEAVYDEIGKQGFPDFSRQIDELQKASQPHPDQAASRIIDVVIEDYLADTPLVNKSQITEVAWENRTGTEPAWD